MRWYLEKLTDPEHVWDAVFDGGHVTVTVTTPGESAQEESLSFASEDDAVQALRERVKPYLEAGFVQLDPPDERYRNHPRVQQFWTDQAEQDWVQLGATPCPPTDQAELVARYLGRPLPPELTRHLRFRSTHQLGFCNYGEWRLWDTDIWLPRPEGGNLFEQLVCTDQDNILATAMMQYFVGWVPVGSTGNGDVYLACPNVYDPERCDVILFDHETHSFQTFVADSLASLAWANHCYRQLGQGDFELASLTEDFSLLQDRVNLPWHYGDLQAETGIEPSMTLSTICVRDFRRCRWIDYLLSQGRTDEVADFFVAEVNEGSFAQALRSPYLRRFTSTALYWLWRLWWFDKPELGTCLDALEDHTSPIVTDAVALVRELVAGRTQLGRIDDIHALRQRFLELDLDPDRAEERAAEHAAAARAAEQRTVERRRAAQAVLDTGDLAAIRECLWTYTDEPEVVDAVVAYLEAHDPASLPQLRRWRYLAERRSQRDGASYSLEDIEIKEALSHDGAIVAPLFSQPRDYRDLLPTAFGGTRALPIFLQALQSDDEFLRGVTAGVTGLGILQAHDHVPTLIALTRSLRWDPNDIIAGIRNQDALLATIDALALLGGDGVTEALVDLLEVPALEAEVWPRVFVALGRLGDEAALPALLGHLDGDARPVLYALAHLGTPASREAIDRHLDARIGDTVQLAYERGMQQLARHRTGAEVDWARVEELTTIVESRRYEDQELHETLAQLLAAHPSQDDAVAMLVDYLHHDHRRVREAALASLRERGAQPEVRWMDRATVDALWDAEGVEGLRTALTDPHAVFRHNIVRKAAHEGVGPQLAGEAVALGRLYCRFGAYTHNYTQSKHTNTYYLVRALIALEAPLADRFLCELWKGPVPMYREAEDLKYARDWLVARMEPFVAEIEAERAARAAADAEETEAEPVPATPFGQVRWLFGGCIHGMCWTPDGEHLVVGGAGGVRILDETGRQVREVAVVRGAHVYDVDVSPDGQLLAIGVHAGHLFVVEVATGATVMKLEGHGGVPNGVRKVRFSPSGAQLASVSDDRTARVWSLADRTCTMVHEDPADVNAVDWVDEDHLVIGTDRMVRLLTTSGEELKAKSASGTAETRVSRERERIYVGSAGKIRVYSLTLAEKRKEHLSQKSLSRLRVHGDTLLATSWEGEDAGLMVWNLATGESHRPEAHRRKTFALDRHPTSGSVGVGGSPGVVERFTPAGALIPREGSFHTKEIEGIRCGPDLLTAGSDNQVIRWSATGDALGAYASPKGRLCSAVSDATRVYVTGTHFTAAFDRATGEPAWISPEPASRSEHLSLAADDRSLVVAGHRCLFWVDRTTGERLHTTDDIIGNWWIHWWADLPGGRLALAGYSDEAVQVFDTATREHVATWALPKSKGGTVCGIASAGDRVLISRRDKTLVVLDGRDGKVVTTATLGGSRYPIAATSDGRWLFGSSGRTVEVYDTERFQQVGAIEAPAKVSALAVDGERLLIGCSTGELATAPIP